MMPPPTMTTSTGLPAGKSDGNADTALGFCQIGSENGAGKDHLRLIARENPIVDFTYLKERFDPVATPVGNFPADPVENRITNGIDL
ncbi:hypothetical protein [Mesorhizobium amorphae]|uniref:hypothetical protein n=1 Tax=Mesorhizobium amorphae TaxID=71433 RepID=UPI0017817443|nr:hypothetical protein [Mesorhizobium amorphae]